MKNAIIAAIKAAFGGLGLEVNGKWAVEEPADSKFGDYSTNAAFVISKIKNQKSKKSNPRDLAGKLVEKLKENKELMKVVDRIEIAGPGFINFFVSENYVFDILRQVLEKRKEYGKVNLGNQQRFSVEHTGPNTNKPLHIGHTRNAILGMALVNILKHVGYDAWSSNINNDRGIHIIKSVWGYQKYGRGLTPETMTPKEWRELLASVNLPKIEPYLYHGKIKSDHFVGLFYIIGNHFAEASEEASNEMHNMLEAWEVEDPEVRKVWKQMNDWFYAGAKITLDRLGVYFDKEWYESKFYDKGKVIVEEGVKKGIFKRFDDGHVEAILEPYGLPNVVLLRKNGTALYITQDFELARQRMQDYGIKYNMVPTGNEQNLRFQQLYKVCELLGYGKKEQFIHLGYGVVRLPSGKMSSRLGNVVLADDLLDKMVILAESLMTDRKIGVELSPDEKNEIKEAVGIGGLKYSMLKVSPKMDITFDFEKSVSLEGDSGPYVQYTYARTRSVLAKIKNQKLKIKNITPLSGGSRYGGTEQNSKINNEELTILRTLVKFPDIVEAAAINYSPNLLCTYLFDLAQKYNTFYNQHRIIDSDNEEFRLRLTEAVGVVLQNGLKLLGIKTLEKM